MSIFDLILASFFLGALLTGLLISPSFRGLGEASMSIVVQLLYDLWLIGCMVARLVSRARR